MIRCTKSKKRVKINRFKRGAIKMLNSLKMDFSFALRMLFFIILIVFVIVKSITLSSKVKGTQEKPINDNYAIPKETNVIELGDIVEPESISLIIVERTLASSLNQYMEIEKETETKVETELEAETEEPTESTTESSAVRPNILYYVNDNNWISTLNIEYQDYLWQMCIKYDITNYYELLMAQMYTESSFRPEAISATNDYGLMQINICNHQWLSEQLGQNDFLNPYTSIEAGALIMSGYLHKYNDAQKALVCYNMGEGAAVGNGLAPTLYSDKVLANMNKLVVMSE